MEKQITRKEHDCSSIDRLEDGPRQRGARGTIKDRTGAVLWCIWAIMVVTSSSYTNAAGNAALGIPRFREDFGHAFNGNYVLPAKWQSAMYGAAKAAAFFGAIGSGWLADKIGRKWTLAIVFAVKFTSITLQTVSTSIEVFFVGNLLGGFTWGGFCTMCTTYISEIAPLPLRGVLTAATPIAMSLGSLIAAIVVNQSGQKDSRWAYRTTFVVGYGISGAAAILLPFAPESPWWLVNNNRDPLPALKKLSYSNEDAEGQVKIITRTIEKSKLETKNVSFMQCFQGTNRRRTIICIMPLTIHALSGVSFVGNYSTYYQQLAGFGESESWHLMIVQQVLSMSGVVGSWWLIDRVGRRGLMVGGLGCLTVILLVTGGLAVAGSPGAIKGTVALLLLYAYVFNLTIGAAAYSITSEAPTGRLRTKTASMAFALENALFTMWGFVLPYLFNPDRANLGAKVTFIFGGLSVLCTVYLWCYQPEFAGRTFEEIDELFARRVSAREWKGARVESERKENV